MTETAGDSAHAAKAGPIHSPPHMVNLGKRLLQGDRVKVQDVAPIVIPAKAGTHIRYKDGYKLAASIFPPGLGLWVPAFAGMTSS